MSGPFEKFVEQAAEVLSPHIQVWRDRDGQERAVCAHDDWVSDTEGYELSDAWAEHLATIALQVVAPLIQEDTRERMVAAAGAALEREGGAAGGCEQAYERGRRETLKEIAAEMALSHPEDPRVRYVEVQLDLDTYRQIMAAREVATEGAS